MKLQATTDYAVRILGYLYRRDYKKARGEDIARELGITFLYFMKIAQVMRNGGLIASVQGCNGGFLLKKRADQVSVYDVVKVMEGDILTARFFEDEERNKENCPVLGYWKTVREAMTFMMKNTTIADIYDRKADRAGGSGKRKMYRGWKEQASQKKALV